MMIYPPIAELVEKTGSRYLLVIEAARRARQISTGAKPLCNCDSNKEVSIATNEIYQDKISIYTKMPSSVLEPIPEETAGIPNHTDAEAVPVTSVEGFPQAEDSTESL